MRLTLPELTEKYLGKRIKYNKGGSRKGWRGEVINVTKGRVNILYDNGVEQDYRLDALHKENGDFHEPYLEVTSQPSTPKEQQPEKAMRVRPYMVVNNQGHLLDSFDDSESAMAFALEQVMDSNKFSKFHIFSAGTVVQTRVPEADVIELNSDGTVKNAT